MHPKKLTFLPSLTVTINMLRHLSRQNMALQCNDFIIPAKYPDIYGGLVIPYIGVPFAIMLDIISSQILSNDTFI